jgi:hypothetical protein
MHEQAKKPPEPIDLALAKLDAVIAEAEKERDKRESLAKVPDDVPRFRTCHVGHVGR